MIVNEETKEKRRDICNVCPNQRENFKLFGLRIKRVKQCRICECSILAKTMFEDSKCPVNKW